MDLNKLTQFLQEAKKKTYASKIFLPKFNLDGSKEYVYKKEGLKYKDRYYGSEIDTGQELLLHNKKLLWSMSYRGGMLYEKKQFSKKCFSFLKECLRNVPSDFPVRGPREYVKRDLKYENIWEGNIEDFVGEEKIFLNGEQIYFRNYLGGMGKARKLG